MANESDHISTAVLREGLQRVAWSIFRAYWKPIVATVAGFILGVAAFKIQLGSALTAAHEAKTAAEQVSADVADLKRAIRELATERELEAANKRIDDFEAWYSSARLVASQPPQRKRK